MSAARHVGRSPGPGRHPILGVEQFEQVYPSEIARAYGLPVAMVQRQLDRLERGGIVLSRLRGRTRLFEWNPDSPFRDELRALMRKALRVLPAQDRKRFLAQRRRPPRVGKPL